MLRNEVKIRKANQNDGDFVLEAVHEMIKICVGKKHIPFIPDDVAKSLWNGFIEDTQNSSIFIAEKDNKKVGVAVAQYHHTLHYLGPICNLQNHFVTSGNRYEGIGSALLEAIEKEAYDAGCVAVELLMPNPGTHLDKERNLFYEKKGYILEGYSRYKTLKPIYPIIE
ncbi:acetyltransferase, GNAT family protein [Tritrichomonas foetus]|uniref:Acetyltransferase, GNAT family protein n=1 Tax=Tritrichomonas foetus TaxID=1144522 RepID=A0A1J4JVQ6_9EUKA|nr:acetyltransferase, GNAT family protein [Tritrichomonas foetus]|eukprot:OHT01620.1 acetyltransferase, GNAT family protein [Tritrichomonas foetus]